MLKHRSLSATAMTFFLILVGAGVAHADAAGAWKLATTGAETCNITLAADGTATGCTNITKWKARGSSLAFYAANGDVVGLLKAKGDTYVGNHMGDNHAMTLSH
jgi:hypothetical protein